MARLFPPLVRQAGLLISLAACPGNALAQETPAPVAPDEAKKDIDLVKEDANDKDVFKFDYGVPSSPALTLIDADKDKLTQANSLKPFVVALPNLLASKGTGQAVALEISPAWFLVGADDRRADKYDAGRAILFRTKIGAAVYEGVSDADVSKQKPSRGAIGISTSLLSSSDPLLARLPGGRESAWSTCLNRIPVDMLGAAPPPANTPAMDALSKRLLEISQRIDQIVAELKTPVTDDVRALREVERSALEREYGAKESSLTDLRNKSQEQARTVFAKSKAATYVPICMKVASLAARTGSDLDLGGGVLWEGKPGKFSGYSKPSAVFWASFRTSLGVNRPKGESWDQLVDWSNKLDRWFMIGASGRVGIGETVATGDTVKPRIRANTFTGWVGLESYTETSRFAAQIGLRKTDPRAASDSAFGGSQFVYLTSFDQEVTDGIWLSVSYGKANGSGALKDDSTVKVSFTFTAPKAKKIFGD